MPFPEFAPYSWLALLCSPPLLVALLLALRSRQAMDIGTVRIGNPILKPDALPAQRDAVLHPLLHLTRTRSDSDLRAIILGLRHMPLKDTAFILRRYQHSADPELQIYSQSILQEKQEQMQSAFARLLPRATVEFPAHLASCIETGLALFASPLTPAQEGTTVLRKLSPLVDAIRDSGTPHPRAVCTAARFCLLTHRIDDAEKLAARLPERSPLRESLAPLIRHHSAIQRPPAPLTTRYTVQ
jgi:hypothetical protein